MNCLVGQSGGPTSVINSSLSGVIQAAIDNGFEKIYGCLHGIEGLLNENLVEIDKDKFEKNNVKDRLMSRPSSILGSCRYKLPKNLEDDIYKKIIDKLKKFGITSFIYIGGNDSMDTVKKLNQYMKKNNIKDLSITGSPKTIDNDLMKMDHSPGFGSAAKFIVNSLINIRCDVDIYNIKTVTFVEIMGRNAGWLAASSLLANYGKDRKVVNLVYVSEHPVSKEKLIKDINEAHKEENNLIVVVSEGFLDSDGQFKDEHYRSYDKGFNHPIISGISRKLSEYVYQVLDIKTKAVELSITQRVNDIISKTDSSEAFHLGYKSLEKSIESTNFVPVIKRNYGSSNYDTCIDFVESDQIANYEKVIPNEWFESKEVFYDKMVEYALPLIEGKVNQEIKNGIIKYVELSEFIK